MTVTWHSYSLIDYVKGSLADVLGKPIRFLWRLGRNNNAYLTVIEVIVSLALKAVELSAGEAPNTAIITSSSAYIVKLRFIAKGLNLEVYKVSVVENHKEMSSFIYF